MCTIDCCNYLFDGRTDADEWRSLVRRDELFKRLVAADHTAPHRLAYNSIQLSLNLTKITMAEVRSKVPWGITSKQQNLQVVFIIVNLAVVAHINK